MQRIGGRSNYAQNKIFNTFVQVISFCPDLVFCNTYEKTRDRNNIITQTYIIPLPVFQEV